MECAYTNLGGPACCTSRLHGRESPLAPGYKSVQHVTVLNTGGNRDALVSDIAEYRKVREQLRTEVKTVQLHTALMNGACGPGSCSG